MSILEKRLVKKYRKLFKIDKIFPSYNNDILNTNVALENNLDVDKNLFVHNSIQGKNVTVKESFNDIFGITGVMNVTLSSHLIVDNDVTCVNTGNNANNVDIGTDLDSTLIKSNDIEFDTIQTSTLKVNTIECSSIVGESIMIVADNINIGKDTSEVNVNGIRNNISVTNIKFTDRLLIFNKDNTDDSTNDDNDPFGLRIYSDLGNYGYITNQRDNKFFFVKFPNIDEINHFSFFDQDENMVIDGDKIIDNDLRVKGTMTIDQNCEVEDIELREINLNDGIENISINVDESINGVFDAMTTTFNSLNVSVTNELNNINYIAPDTTVTIANIITETVTVDTKCSIFTTLDSLGNINTGSLVVGGDITTTTFHLTGDATVNDSFYTGNITCKDFHVKNNTICDNLTSLSSLSISTNSIINNDLHVSSSTSIGNNLHFVPESTLFVKGFFIKELDHYDNNQKAHEAGVGNWELYRTADIVKIKLDVVPPVFTIFGDNPLTISGGLTDYIEPGVDALDAEQGLVDVIIASIEDSNGIEYTAEDLDDDIVLVPNTRDMAVPTSLPLVSPEDYTITYITTDIIGNEISTTRTLLLRA